MPDPTELHDRQVSAVTDAVAKLLVRLQPAGFTPEAIFEGAVKGGAVALMARTPATAVGVANLLMDVARSFDRLDKPALRIVD